MYTHRRYLMGQKEPVCTMCLDSLKWLLFHCKQRLYHDTWQNVQSVLCSSPYHVEITAESNYVWHLTTGLVEKSRKCHISLYRRQMGISLLKHLDILLTAWRTHSSNPTTSLYTCMLKRSCLAHIGKGGKWQSTGIKPCLCNMTAR